LKLLNVLGIMFLTKFKEGRTMKTLNKSGIESGAKYLTFLSVWALAFLPVNLQADTVWESGHHEIFDGNIYSEIWMYNDCTLDIFGGDNQFPWGISRKGDQS